MTNPPAGAHNRFMTDITEIWCDGSYRQQPRTAGAGWVIRHTGGQINERALTLPRLHNSFAYGSQIAELAAAMNAMNEAPVGPPVVVHMDCEIALRSLRGGVLILIPKNPAPSLQTAFKKALEARNRHESVTFLIASDRTDHRMSAAHKLSRQASAPANLTTPKTGYTITV